MKLSKVNLQASLNRKHRINLLVNAGVVALGLFLINPHGGIFLALPLWFFGTLYVLISSVRRVWWRREWVFLGCRLLMWVVGLSIFFCLIRYYSHQAQTVAETVLHQLQQKTHAQYQGLSADACPNQAEQLGLDPEPIHQYRIRFGCLDGNLFLFYPSTTNPFDKYDYDFETKTWKFDQD